MLVTELAGLGWLPTQESFRSPPSEPLPPGAGQELAPQCWGRAGDRKLLSGYTCSVAVTVTNRLPSQETLLGKD